MKKSKFKRLSFIPFIVYPCLLAAEPVNLSEITVSANKVEENILNVPQTITVINNSELEEKEIKNISDVIKQIPNLTSRYLYFDSVNFRGINTSAFTNNNPVVIYIDGIPHSSKFGYNASLANVERIEVLRGPQGTLYGKDSIGGVINIITRTPTNEFEGEVGLEYGTNNFFEKKFNFSGPIKENILFLGVNGIFSEDDGWITNHYKNLDDNANRSKAHNLNGNILYQPTDNFSARLNISEDKDDRYWVEGGIIPTKEKINDATRKDFENANYDTDTFTKIKSTSQALNLSYNFKDINITSLTTHKKVDMDGDYDPDWSTDPRYKNLTKFQYSTTKTFTQELRLSNKNKKLKWLFGLYYEDEEFNNEKYGMQRPPNIEINAVSQTNSKTYATFGQIIYPLFKNLDLTIGGRYQKIKKDIDLDYYMSQIGSNSAPSYILNDDNTWNTFLPKLALSYKINKNINTYFNISKGYLPGGYNYFSNTGDGSDNLFDAQTSINYELGIKGNFLENKLFLSSSIFYMDIDDIHIYNYDTNSGMMYVSNAAKAHSQGLEVEVKYNFLENWAIESSIGLIQAKYDDYGSNDLVKDNKIENTPSHTINLGLSYYNPKGYYGRIDIQNQGNMYFDSDNTIKQSSFTTGNIKIGYNFDNWDIYSYVKNVTDEEYLTTVKTDQGGYMATVGEGRFVGIGVKYYF